mmetsp:Transcript_19458/g.54243  ORF Transcript_19458/g.54243 Transcript_19458/m.54243 type:complete len:633 (+) Transcript_19458:181-2079(+)
MPSPVRTAKRQRLDNSWVGISKEAVAGGTGMHQSASLIALVEEFAGVQLADSEHLIETLEKIRSQIHLLECSDSRQDTGTTLVDYHKTLSICKLHGNLILYLGFLLGSFKETPIPVFRSLVFCLRDLYTNDTITITKYVAEEQCGELFILIPKLLRLTTEKFHEIIIFSEEQNVRDIMMGCFQIIRSWLKSPVILDRFLVDSTTTTLENFLLGIFVLTDKDIIGNGTAEFELNALFEGLESRFRNQSAFRRLLDVTVLAARSRPLAPCHQFLSPRLEIYYWRCRSRVPCGGGSSKSGSRIIQTDNADRAVGAMIQYCTSNNRVLARKAMQCMIESTDDTNDATCMRLMQFLLESIMKELDLCNSRRNGSRAYYKEMERNLMQRLECLGLCMKRDGMVEYFLQIEDWEKAFDVLVSVSVTQEDIIAAEKAAAVVVPILKSLFTRAKEEPLPLLFDRALAISIELVSSHSERVVGQILNLLFDVVKNAGLKRRVKSNSLLPDLISALAQLSSRNFLVEESTKGKLALTFARLVNEVKNRHFLAREMSNLSFLVRLAAGSYCEANRSRVQQISISVLVALARNPCNRRILAKEPGLLSSLIRYTRMTPEGSDVFVESSMSRNEVKERILLIADAL